MEYAGQLQAQYDILVSYDMHFDVLRVSSSCGKYFRDATPVSPQDRIEVSCILIEHVVEMIKDAAN
jgi:hypothetical protein